eukprot:scaffold655224_cov93-Prasinocladus_malaysianus.AAC.1
MRAHYAGVGTSPGTAWTFSGATFSSSATSSSLSGPSPRPPAQARALPRWAEKSGAPCTTVKCVGLMRL